VDAASLRRKERLIGRLSSSEMSAVRGARS
jgi:hypothetical protein